MPPCSLSKTCGLSTGTGHCHNYLHTSFPRRIQPGEAHDALLLRSGPYDDKLVNHVQSILQLKYVDCEHYPSRVLTFGARGHHEKQALLKMRANCVPQMELDALEMLTTDVRVKALQFLTSREKDTYPRLIEQSRAHDQQNLISSCRCILKHHQ